MGKSITPKYVVNTFHVGIQASTAAWRGRATEKRLREYVNAYNESIKVGGCNARVGEIFGIDKALARRAVISTNDSNHDVIAEVVVP